MNEIRFSFIVLNFNTKVLTETCLEAICAACVGNPLEIILVDNGSSDGSIEYLSKRFNNIIIVKNQKNLGFAAANNQGLAIAKGAYVFLINSDVIITKEALTALINFMDLHQDAAIAGTNLIVVKTGKIQPFSFGYAPTMLKIFNQFLGFFYFSKNIPLLRGITACSRKSGKPLPVDWVSGACMAVRMNAYRAVGGFKEDYFFYGEDIEWCLRFKKANWKVYFLADAKVKHFLGSSQKTQEQRMAMVENWYKNLRSLFIEMHPRQPIFLFDIFAVVGFFARYIVSSLKSIFIVDKQGFEAAANKTIVRTALAGLLQKI